MDKITIIPSEKIDRSILLLRGQKVMLDADLAVIYGLKTSRLNEQVKRNISRFPEDFMFQLTEDEFSNLMSQIATSSWGSRRKMPFVFTEHGVLMLSSVLSSELEIKVNIQIMRVYIKIRKMLASDSNLLLKFENVERTLTDHDDKIILILEYIRQLEVSKQNVENLKHRPKIGFRAN